ncbi:hypothetical protein [Streptomyces zagrosensis]|uniref:Uncharacterized protein n=1 Tax=Streptomyces zagrosensis TaxID=1042984 RepID=A0A7W9V2L6_9ACTN|nr:hypothetical protein [Streptomyces zagrosensis]MBB5939421.1 hypothetical protein [Streptomyces zagrosensis]
MSEVAPEHPAAQVAEILRYELAAYGVWSPELRAEESDGTYRLRVAGPIPLGAGFALLRVLGDYERLLRAERARLKREQRAGRRHGQRSSETGPISEWNEGPAGWE